MERGNHLIFADSIYKVTGREPELGDRVVVCDTTKKIIGWGIWNPRSIYRVRILQTLTDCTEEHESVLDLQKTFQRRLESATRLRSAMGLPNESTNAYRLVNSDGDHLSGVIIDRFDDVIVVHSGTCWLELNRDMVVQTLQSVLGIDAIVWRLRPVIVSQEGVPNAKEAIYTSNASLTLQSQIPIVENDVKYVVSLSGQKTGFYGDQRDNRRFLQSLTRDKTVLDLCCYTGGFSIHAALGGAKDVLGIDSSQPAIDLAKTNAEMNGVESICRFECSDILNRLQVYVENNVFWDVVVLDPPKLAFSRSKLNKSLSRYRKLNRAAMKVIRPGGFLMTCSCSGLIDLPRFVQTVWEAADQIGKRLTVLRQSGAASDHVYDLNHPEGSYLKCLVVRVE